MKNTLIGFHIYIISKRNVSRENNENRTILFEKFSYNYFSECPTRRKIINFRSYETNLNNSILKVLRLESNGITEKSARYLAEMLKTNKRLISPGLDENDIDDR
jgi:hypothetical protein